MPAQFLYYAPFAALALAYWVVMSRKRQNMRASTSSMRIGEISRQLGMTLEKGDPDFHLAMDATPSTGAEGVLLAGTRLPYSSPTTEVVARGTLDGRNTEFYFYAKASVGVRIGLGRDVEVDRVCRLSMTPRIPVADFELVLRQPRSGAEAERILPDAPEVLFGDARLDQRYQLGASSPDVGRLLSGAMNALDDQVYVHVVAQEGQVSMLFSLGPIYLLASTPRIFLQKLAILTDALEQRV